MPARKSSFSAAARLISGVALILSPWAAYLLDLLHGIADALLVLTAVVTGFLLVASGALHIRRTAANTRSSATWHGMLHGVAVAAVALLVLLLTVRALAA